MARGREWAFGRVVRCVGWLFIVSHTGTSGTVAAPLFRAITGDEHGLRAVVDRLALLLVRRFLPQKRTNRHAGDLGQSRENDQRCKQLPEGESGHYRHTCHERDPPDLEDALEVSRNLGVPGLPRDVPDHFGKRFAAPHQGGRRTPRLL